MNEVKPELTGWRDMELSLRHRKWGFNCPAVDLDFAMIEYNWGKPCALVEYKTTNAEAIDVERNRSIQALINTADGHHEKVDGVWVHRPMACMLVRYAKEPWKFIVTPLNDRATAHYAHCIGEALTEQRFVRSLHLLRKSVLTTEDEAAIAQLNSTAISTVQGVVR